MLLAIDWFFIAEKCILIAAIIGLSLFVAMYETWAERKVAAIMQDRRSPTAPVFLVFFSLLQMD